MAFWSFWNFFSLWRFIGIIISIVGLLGVLGALGASNPFKSVSDPLFGFTRAFLSGTASLIFWVFVVITGLSLAGPEGGYIRSIHGWGGK